MMWFGKTEAVKAAKGIGNFIDEQQFTKEEQIRYKLHMFEIMGPFKGIQRTIATWVMIGWFSLLCLGMLSLMTGYILSLFSVKESLAFLLYSQLLLFVQTEFVWVPCFGVFTLYLSGGLSVFKSKK